MSKMILITGGAGFIGLHVARRILKAGGRVKLLDNFSPQVHSAEMLPADLVGAAELVKGDVRDRDVLRQALMGVDDVIHLAAETGTTKSAGQGGPRPADR